MDGGEEWWKQGRIAQEEREAQHVVTTLESISLFLLRGRMRLEYSSVQCTLYTTVLRYGTRCHRLFRGWYHVLEEEIAAPFPLGGTARIPSYLRRYKGLRAQPPPSLGETEEGGRRGLFLPPPPSLFCSGNMRRQPKKRGRDSILSLFLRRLERKRGEGNLISFPFPPHPSAPRSLEREKSLGKGGWNSPEARR